MPHTFAFIDLLSWGRVGKSIIMKKLLYFIAVLLISCEKDSSYAPQDQNILTAVDLGLSVKWANMNIGASSPEEYGNYYAWGETTVKTYYDWDTYKWGRPGNFTKYNFLKDWGIVDNKGVLDLVDDVAHVKLGGKWRMPTKDEWAELKSQCTYKKAIQNGVKGLLVTGKNGNSIFLPAAGYKSKDEVSISHEGYYWSSSLHLEGGGVLEADCGRIYPESWMIYSDVPYVRHIGFPVRPVLE